MVIMTLTCGVLFSLSLSKIGTSIPCCVDREDIVALICYSLIWYLVCIINCKISLWHPVKCYNGNHLGTCLRSQSFSMFVWGRGVVRFPRNPPINLLGWGVVAERSSLIPDSSSGVSSRMWVRIPAVTLVSLSKTLNHNCFSPPRG